MPSLIAEQSGRAPLTMYQQFVEQWGACRECDLHLTRKRIVLAKGQIPCDVLLVGEAPGASEDVRGIPFDGPAGRLLDDIVRQAIPESIRVAYSNLLCCIPLDESGVKTEKPPDWAVEACKPRLEHFVRVASPRLIVTVGKEAHEWLDPGYKHSVKLPKLPNGEPIPQVRIDHPAHIIRQSWVHQGLLIQKAIVALRNAIEDYLEVP